MEGNRDESEKCISIAQKCINVGAYEKALKFLNKAERLYPTQKAKGNRNVSIFSCYQRHNLSC